MTRKKDRSRIGLVSDYNFPNVGIVQGEGLPVHIKGVLPGQEVKYLPGRKRDGFNQGKVLEVLRPSPLETNDGCPAFPKCGGCLFQSISLEEEKKLKHESLEKLFARDLPFYENPQTFYYRNKMEYTFGDAEKGGELILGLHRRRMSYEIVDTIGCNIAPRDFELIRQAVMDYFREKGTPQYARTRGTGILRHLMLRYSHSRKQNMILLATTSDLNLDKEEFVRLLRTLELEGTVASVFLCTNDDRGDAINCQELELLYGQNHITEDMLGLSFKITPFSFFQPNVFCAEDIYKRVVEMTRDWDGLVFDLFSGTGTITQILASQGKEVIGVEIVPEAVEASIENAKTNNIERAKFICGDVYQVLREIEERPAGVIIDPPRSGIAPKALRKILDMEPENFVYISCNPNHLAKDLEVFEERGYELIELEAHDQFTRTYHCEMIAKLKRK